MSFWKRKKEATCPSGNWKNKLSDFLPFFAGTTLILLAVLVVRQRISAMEKDLLGNAAPAEIVVAADPISPGSVFSHENLAKKSIPSSGTTRRNVPASDFELLLGARAKVEISKGEPVLWTDVQEPIEVDNFSMTIPNGRRAITIDADTKASFSGLLRPGDHVDILRGEKEGEISTPVLFDVPVIAVDRHFLSPPSEEEGYEIGTITVSVTPDEATRLSAAARDGSLSWLLRNPGDRGRPSKRASLWATAVFPVEIWKAGIRERKTPADFEPGASE